MWLARCTWRWLPESPMVRGFSSGSKCCRSERAPAYNIWISLVSDNLNSLNLNSTIPWCRASKMPKIRMFSLGFYVDLNCRPHFECDFQNTRKWYNIRIGWVSKTTRKVWIRPARKSALENTHTICTGQRRRSSKWWTVFVHCIYLNQSLKY